MKTWKKWTYGMGNFANTVAQQVFNNRIQTRFPVVEQGGISIFLGGP